MITLKFKDGIRLISFAVEILEACKISLQNSHFRSDTPHSLIFNTHSRRGHPSLIEVFLLARGERNRIVFLAQIVSFKFPVSVVVPYVDHCISVRFAINLIAEFLVSHCDTVATAKFLRLVLNAASTPIIDRVITIAIGIIVVSVEIFANVAVQAQRI